MKLNIAYPRNGTVKQFVVSDEQLRKIPLDQYRLGHVVDGEIFGDEFRGYSFHLRGGCDRQGFPMMHGVMTSSRVKLLIKRGAVGFNIFRGRNGERRRKSVRGCQLGPDISVLNVVIVRTGDQPIEGLTDISVSRRLGPKRANNIRKLFNLGKDVNVCQYLVKRVVSKEGKQNRVKCAKVQRLIIPKIQARRAMKVTAQIDKLRRSAELRREYLSLVSRRRMVNRQRKNALVHKKEVGLARMEASKAKKAIMG